MPNSLYPNTFIFEDISINRSIEIYSNSKKNSLQIIYVNSNPITSGSTRHAQFAS